jgi:hypothetical protein
MVTSPAYARAECDQMALQLAMLGPSGHTQRVRGALRAVTDGVDGAVGGIVKA